jgi:hypothetical protein
MTELMIKQLMTKPPTTKIMMVLAALILSCTTPGKVVVRSKPENATVYFLDGKSGQSALVGKTPLTFDRSNANPNGNELIQLRIEKDGFEPRYAAVTAFGQETTFLDLTLQQPMVAKGEVRAAFEESRHLMEEVNRLLLNKRYSEALMATEKMLQLDPKNAEAHAAKGSVLYLMKDYDGASSSWTHALELNAAFDSVRESLIHLSNERPSRGSASVGGN